MREDDLRKADFNEVVERVDVLLLEASEGEIGGDEFIFVLDGLYL